MLLNQINHINSKERTMKTSILRALVLTPVMAVSVYVSAQFNVTMASSSDPNTKFVSAINTDESTYLYVTKTSRLENEIFTCGKLTATIGFKSYKLKNCYNVPKYNEAEPSYIYMGKKGQAHNFILEFEKLPLQTEFDITEEMDSGAWVFSGVKIDTLSRMEYINPNDFVGATPAKIYGNYASNGIRYSYYMYNGIILTAYFAKGDDYGKYYQVYLDIINNTDHSIAFNIENVKAQGYTFRNGIEKYFALKTLSAEEYDKKVRNRQAWSVFFNALGQINAANNAGITTVNTTATTNSYGSSYTNGGYSGGSVYTGAAVGTGGAAVGIGASAYSGRYYSNTYSNSTATTNSSTVIHNGAMQYMAQQQAAQNIASYDNALAYDRANLWANYLKLNTIRPGQSYGGFFNIKYKKADRLEIKIKIDGVAYTFLVSY